MNLLQCSALALVLSVSTVYADKPSHAGKEKKEKKQKKEKHQKKQKHKKEHKKNFSSYEKGHIQDYYHNLPRGLAKKLKRTGELPPGWQKKVSVGQAMPSDYLQYASPVPYELESQLSVGPIGSKLLQLSDRVIRVEAGTNMILDAFKF